MMRSFVFKKQEMAESEDSADHKFVFKATGEESTTAVDKVETALRVVPPAPVPPTVGEALTPQEVLVCEHHRHRWHQVRDYVGDKLLAVLRFVLISGSIFLALVVLMNFSAYREAFAWWWQQQNGEADQNAARMQSMIQSNTTSTVSLPNQMAQNKVSLNIPIVSPDNRILIPKIGKNVPLMEVPDRNLKAEDWDKLEADIQYALKSGVIHYPGTAFPGQVGNFFVTGHSSYYPWDDGKYKDVFAALHSVEVGDEVLVFYNQTEYRYRIIEKKVVAPTEVDVLAQTNDKRITLMTCTPIGTNLNRLILVGQQVEGE